MGLSLAPDIFRVPPGDALIRIKLADDRNMVAAVSAIDAGASEI
jgi:hypothetical protein